MSQVPPAPRAPQTMPAMVLDRAGLTVRSQPIPRPAAGEALVRVAACAVCQSDLHFIRDQQATLGTGAHAGQVLGHELAGTVAAVGAGVAGLPVGARVTARPLASCGVCIACRRGLIRACPHRSVIGFTRPGAFAAYVCIPAAVVYRVPDGVSFAAAALAEPLACAYNAVAASGVQPSDWAVVVGPGPLGLLATRLLKLRGAMVLVAGTRTERLDAARRFGADAVCDVRREDLREMALSRTGGLGADAALEMVGSSEALETALGCTRLGGRVVLAGEPVPGTTFQIEPHRLFYQEQQIVASIGAGESFPRVLRLLAEGLVAPEQLITHVFALEQAPDAVAAASARRDGALKVLVEPTLSPSHRDAITP